MVTGEWPEWGSWSDLDVVRASLTAGADPNARLHAIRNTPLHKALWEFFPSVNVIELLLSHGADVEAVNDAGETPLWCAVRRGHDEEAAVLLAAGADPWRPVLGGRSAGMVALDGPLATLFADLPGAPPLNEAERRRQAEADALIASYSELSRVSPGIAVDLCIAFVAGLDENEVIRRAGADPADCPTTSVDELNTAVYTSTDGSPGTPVLWIGTPPGGGVVVYDPTDINPRSDEFCGRVSAGNAALASMFDNPAGGDQCVDWWRDGKLVARPSPSSDPRGNDPSEAWLCRFGDSSHDSSDVARDLALMSMLTGTHPDAAWLAEAPKRLVRLPG